jgi:ribosome biogenesis GTPase
MAALKGTIIKGIGGFYYVLEDGCEPAGGEAPVLHECRGRGIFRLQGITPLAGDRVEFTPPADEGSGFVDRILPRLNAFERPPVANVETMVLVAAAKEPEPSFPLLDRFCVMAEKMGSRVAICVNKEDIGDPDVLQRFRNVYGPIYPVFVVSAKTGEGVAELKLFLKGTQAALAGPSGVGKSSLANLLLERGVSETGEISRKTMRGRNTTRHTQLFLADGFRLFDTPGFTSFELGEVEEADLQHFFPEFAPYLGKCRFDNCRHLDEPGCAVSQAAADKKISRRRYASYRDMLQTLQRMEKY